MIGRHKSPDFEKNQFYLADQTPTRGRNTGSLYNQNCTVWYNDLGQVIYVGVVHPAEKRGPVKSLILKCDEIGILPEIFNPKPIPIDSQEIALVLCQARTYRYYLEHPAKKSTRNVRLDSRELLH